MSDFLKNLDPPLVEQLELSDFTVNPFHLAEARLKDLKGRGKLAKPVDWGAFIYPDLMRKVLSAKVSYKP